MLKLAKTLILPNYQEPNTVFVNLTIQESKFCKVAQLFIVSVSLVRFFFERRKDYFSVENPCLGSKCLVFIGESLPILMPLWPRGTGSSLILFEF